MLDGRWKRLEIGFIHFPYNILHITFKFHYLYFFKPMKKVILLITVIFTKLIYSQSIPYFHWAHGIGGTSNDLSRAITKDASGNVYTTGGFGSIVDFDPGVGSYTLNSATGNVFVSKLDINGNFVWARNFGGGFGNGNSIELDALGNVYVTGNFSGTQDFDPGVGTVTLSAIGNIDVFIVKLNSSGNFIWANQIGGAGFENARAIHIDSNDDVYTTGEFSGTVDFDPGVGTFNLNSVSSVCYISKLSSAGVFTWAKIIEANANNIGTSISTDGSSNVYITGSYMGTADFDTGPSITNIISQGAEDIFVLKLDVAGNYIWSETLGSTGTDVGQAISLDASGNIYTSGYYGNLMDFDNGPGTATYTPAGQSDIFILKLDQTGNFVWAKSIGGTDIDQAMANDVDASGNVYTTGNFKGTVDFDPGVGTFNLTSAGLEDIFISKLNPSGNFEYAGKLGGAQSDFGYGIAADDGDIHTSGLFSASGDFDPGVANYSLTSQGNDDILVHKMRQCTALSSSVTIQDVTTCNGYSNGSATITPSGNGPLVYAWLPFGGNSVTATNLGSGNYTCNITNTCAVQISQTLFISQPAQLNIVINASSPSVCIGNSSTLTANVSGGTGIISHTWVSGPTGSVNVVSPAVPTVYTLNVSDANNCTKTQTYTVGTFSIPIISHLANDTIICIGESVTYTALGANNYSWQPGNLTGSTVIVSPTVTTDYTVTGIDLNGCLNTLLINQVVDPCIGIFENNLKANVKVKVYPNPNNGLFYLETDTDAQIIITNALGQIILSEKIEMGKNTLSIENNSTGIYFMTVVSKNGNQNLKIVKE